MAARVFSASMGTGIMLALLALGNLLGPAARAQEPAAEAPAATDASPSLAPELSRILREQARAALERHLRPDEFQLFVTAVPAATLPEPLPYLPETLSSLPGPDATPESLAPFLQRIDVEVLIIDRYDQAAKAKLATILEKTLAMNTARGDKVTFSPLGLKVDPPESEVQRDLVRAEAESRELKTKLDTLGRERDDAKRDLTQTKGELDRVAREKPASEKAGAKDDKERPEQAQAPGQPADKGFWRENAAVLVGALLILAALIAASLGVRTAARTLGMAVQSIGAGIPLLGEKLGESMAQRAQPLLPAADSRTLDAKASGGQTAAPTGGAALPMEMVAKRVLELHDELLPVVNEATEGLVLEHLSYLLDDQDTVGYAVASMELLGKDKANDLYGRLSFDHQKQVSTFLRIGTHARPKGEIMIEVGEALKTKLFGASFPSRAQLAEPVKQKLLLLKPDDLASVAKTLEGDHLARFFVYLEPARLGLVLSRLREGDSARFDKATLLLARIPEVEADKALDHEVVAAVEEQLARANADVQGPYLSYYKALVESVDDDVAESISERLASSSPRVERFMREAVVTFGTFFKLHGDIQEEIVLALANKDLAAVVGSLKADLKDIIYGHVEARRKELVEEEVDRLAAKGPRQVAAAHRAAKRLVVARILQIKGTGSMAEMLVKKPEGLPEASSGNNPKAA